AIALDPGLPDPHHWYSHLLTALGRREESLNESRRALELSPSDPRLIAHLGWHHLMAGEYEQAESLLARVVAIRPSDTDAHYLLARLAEARGDYVQADEHLARVTAPASARPWVQAEI